MSDKSDEVPSRVFVLISSGVSPSAGIFSGQIYEETRSIIVTERRTCDQFIRSPALVIPRIDRQFFRYIYVHLLSLYVDYRHICSSLITSKSTLHSSS